MPPIDPELLNKFNKLSELEVKVDRLSELENKVGRIAELEIALKKAEIEKDAYTKEISKLEAINRGKDDEIIQLKSKMADLTSKNQELSAAMEAASKLRPMMKIEDLTAHFKEVIAALNKQLPKEGERPVIVENLEAEVKGGIDLKNGVHLTQVLSQELSPQNVSTIRFTLRPASSIRIAKE